MAKRGNGGMTKWLWYAAAAVVGYVVLDKLGIIDQLRSKIGSGNDSGDSESNVGRVDYAYTSQEESRRWLNSQYPETASYTSQEESRRWLNSQYPETASYIGDAYGQGSQSMSGDYNSIPPVDSIDNQD